MSNYYSPETTSRLAALRAKCADGSITKEELAEGIRLMRSDQYSAVKAAQAAGSRPKRAGKAPVDVGALFDDLDKIAT